MTKKIAILGSTGSIGINSLEVIRSNPELFTPVYLTTNARAEILIDQVKVFRPKGVVVIDPTAAEKVRMEVGDLTEVLVGEAGLLEIVGREDVDLVLSALVGFAGLAPTIRAIECGKDIALANKETLVVAGEIITALVRERNVHLLPIDSEHSAILQCLQGENISDVSKLILTASGGPFRAKSLGELMNVTVQDALNHPNWKMGNKITIDSATLMNKGLEVIEAHWLFDLPIEKIDVLIHPQSIIHSMVEFRDGSVKAQLGIPDMKIPIQYALTYPRHLPSNYERIDFKKFHTLTFAEPDTKTFRCLALAYQAIDTGGTSPTVMNAANEIAVHAFLQSRISFASIPTIIEESLNHVENHLAPQLETIIAADRKAREFAFEYISQPKKHISLTI